MGNNGDGSITIKVSRQDKGMIQNAARLQSIGGKMSLHEFCRVSSVLRAHQVMVDEGDWKRYKEKYESIWGPMNLDFLKGEVMGAGVNKDEAETLADDPAFDEEDEETEEG